MPLPSTSTSFAAPTTAPNKNTATDPVGGERILLPQEANRMLFLGDSITYQGSYVAYVEAAVNLCKQAQPFTFINCGLPSETVSGLSEPNHADGAFPRPDLQERLDRVLSQIQPDVVFACYGINDGIYLPLAEARFQAFQDGMCRLHEAVVRTSATIIHVTPPVYDGVLGQKPDYAKVLAAEAEWLRGQRQNGWQVIDVYGPMAAYLSRQRELNPEFRLADDGVHPGRLGHWLIAKEILSSLGFQQAAGCQDVAALAARHSEGESVLRLVTQCEELVRDAWLTTTGHKRPGLNPGLPLAEAEAKAQEIHAAIQALLEISEARPCLWNGFSRREFQVNGSAATLVVPEEARPGKPWVWRTEFFGAFPSVDIALLHQGFHVAYVSMPNLYGGPAAMDAMDEFYTYILNEDKLAPTPVLEGFSRGGLYALNWAARNPDKVAALYLDAPVCDFKSWPRGKSGGKGSTSDWERCLQVYGLSEADALRYPLNPVDNLQAIAEAKIPIIAVAGDADDVVPMDENIRIVEQRYRDLGGEIQLIVKPGVGHHPHSLDDPTPVVDFLLQHDLKPVSMQHTEK